MNHLVTVICAAGFSSRFGSPKLLSVYHNETLLTRAIRLCREAGLVNTAVVTGTHHDIYASWLKDVTTWRNPTPEQGLASTLRCAITQWQTLRPHAKALLVLLPDLIFSAETLSAILESYRENPERPVVCHYPNTMGPPSLIPKKLWADVLQLSGDRGAQSILLQAGARAIPCPIYHDIDTPQQLQELTEF